MRAVVDLRIIQKKWFVTDDFRYFTERLLTKLKERNQENELFAVLAMEDEMEPYFKVLEKMLPRDRVKTVCFYPETDPEDGQDRVITNAFENWFFSQFHAHEILVPEYEDINAEGPDWTDSIRRFHPENIKDTAELVRILHPVVRCRTDLFLAELATSIEDSRLFSEKKSIYIYMNGTVLLDHVTGIQRVVKGFIEGISALTDKGSEYRTVPVYSFGHSNDFYPASRKGDRFSKQKHEDASLLVQFHDGDILFMPDLDMDSISYKRPFFKKLKQRGVGIFTYLHDLFPLHYPSEFYEADITTRFTGFLETITELSGVISNSVATQDNFECWCRDTKVEFPAYFVTDYVYLGADIGNAAPSTGFPEDIDDIIEAIDKRTTLLIVGSIAPRKNHETVLNAFELLWEKGVDANLVFVGHIGWKLEEFTERIKNYKSEKFIWLKNASDECLDLMYKKSDGVIFVTEDEGYGLPIIEAARYGKPLFLRNLKIFREVAGEYAMYYEGSKDPFRLASALEAWIGEIRSGKAVSSENIRAYSWRESSERILDLITGRKEASDVL